MSQCVTSRSNQFVTSLSLRTLSLVKFLVEPIRNKPDTISCQRRMYTMDQSFPNLQNSIKRDFDILHWFQFLRLTDQEKIHSQVRKIKEFCGEYFSLLRSLVFTVKDTFTKRFTNASLRRFYCLFVCCL